MPGMLMMVALDSLTAAAFAPASDVSVSKLPEMSSVGMALATGWRMASGADVFLFPVIGLIRASLSTHPASEACQRRQPILLLLRTQMYEIASGCKKSVGVE